ncbi:MAG: hypothetical protein GYA59_06855 [Chloroflexi bacterium]|nr:hypothetical protein [Chloroflexota bacterium]
MAQTPTNCPRCRQMVMVEVEQLFDMNTDPTAKQRLLSGNYNLMRCPHCGYEGAFNTPIVYHDPEKELLLTYFPPDLGVAVNDQERQIGPLINRVVNQLPADKRKAYLFRPQTMLTMETMVEKILEADGITREMIQEQQNRLNLLQRLLSTAPEGRSAIIQQEEGQITAEFFALLNRLIESTAAQGDQEAAQQLLALQQQLLNETKAGQELQEQVKETEEAVKSLQEASQKGLTREALLDLIINAPTETRLTTLVSLARSGLDYTFFQLLSDRIESASSEEKDKLNDLRTKLLEMTREIDQAVQEQMKEALQALNQLLDAPDIEQAITENPGLVNDFFIDVLHSEFKAATEKGDAQRRDKLQKVIQTIEKLSAPPPEVDFIKQLLAAEDAQSRQQLFQANSEKITPKFIELLNGLVAQSENQGEASSKISQRLREVYREALRYSMQANLNN